MLHSEIVILCQLRVVCLAFVDAHCARYVLAFVPRCVDRAHAPAPPVSLFRLVVQVRSSFDTLVVALPLEYWLTLSDCGTAGVIERPLQLPLRTDPKRVATSNCGSKPKSPKRYVDGRTAESTS